MNADDALPDVCFDCATIFYGSHSCSISTSDSGSAEYLDRQRTKHLSKLRQLIDQVLAERDG